MTIVILSVLTNFLADDLDETSTEAGVNQSFTKTLVGPGGIFPFCLSFPQVRFFLCPPNIRKKPSWFPRMRPCILRVLHHFLEDKPANLMLLDDFSGEFEADSVHFTILDGINFVQSIVDQASKLLTKPPVDPIIR